MRVPATVRFVSFGAFLLAPALCTAAAKEKPAPLSVSSSAALQLAGDQASGPLPDFSHAGYLGGGVALPLVPARIRLSPSVSGADDTARIQQAIDWVSRLAPDSQGFRGAVLLSPGVFRVSGSLLLSVSGVVLRGSGEGQGGTVLLASGADRRSLIRIQGAASPLGASSKSFAIADSLVPVGATRLTLAGTAGGTFRAGDEILVTRPGTPEWIASLGMDTAPGPTTYFWRPGMVDLTWSRRIVSVSGNTLQLDTPLTSPLEARHGGATVTLAPVDRRVSKIGVERLACVSEWDESNPCDEEHAWLAVDIDRASDSWVRNVVARGFAFSAVQLGIETRRISVVDCAFLAPVSELAGYRRHAFQASGEQHLFLRCRSEGARHDFVAGYRTAGPVAFVDCSATTSHGSSGSVGSWASGLLFDNVSVEGGSLALDNLEITDQGTGWNAANSVLWQCSASLVICRRPPESANVAAGVWGQLQGNGVWYKANEFIDPESLYRAQLSARLGPKALSSLEALSSWSTPHEATAPALESLDTSSLLAQASPAPSGDKPLSLRNGWLVVGDQLLHGNQREVAWWRGQMNPSRSAESEVALTRFAPGRTGPGLTDELLPLADALLSSGTAVLRHHYGLWYDRRRDDHERTSRATAEVWPPFFELPWARSGSGRSWNGVSRYDLTRFNPWYFGRLREFAGLARERGLVLVNEMYFQHNILEAGAHWVDFPWRPANALQETGFPEPPVFAGGKRIFMAREFYDVTHPVRRPLHERYIRQCLSNLAGQPNVIHTLGEEYTGPLSFARFWTETVAAWKLETGAQPLISLSTTKDVQDALLADAATARVYDIIELKYWWKSPKGLFAPEGGKDLAPRQFQREWKGGRPTSGTIAEMTWQYRSAFPSKAVVTVFDEADAWATLAAGGSLPRLPASTDEALLRAIPAMSALGPRMLGGSEAWVLAEQGRQAFVYLPAGGGGELALPGFAGSCEVRSVDLSSGAVSSSAIRRQTPSVEAPRGAPAAFWIVFSTTQPPRR